MCDMSERQQLRLEALGSFPSGHIPRHCFSQLLTYYQLQLLPRTSCSYKKK